MELNIEGIERDGGRLGGETWARDRNTKHQATKRRKPMERRIDRHHDIRGHKIDTLKHMRSTMGRQRSLSKATGEREDTPEQEDMLPCVESDGDEAGDVADVLRISMAREEDLQREVEAIRSEIRSGRQGGESEEEDGYASKEMDNDREDTYDGCVSFGGSTAISAYSRKEAKKSRRPKFERPEDGVMRPGMLTRAGTVDGAGGESGLHARTDGGFVGLGVSEIMTQHLEKNGFVTPTPVQERTIPLLLNGKDAMVESATGSGKTLSYIIPILEQLASRSPRIDRSKGTYALILCPTRELCLQVLDVAIIVARRYAWIVPGSIHGGENRAKEKARLRKGVNILISTPGRLLDHLSNTASFHVDKLEWIVLDEADRLLDLGFKKQIGNIINEVKARRSNAHGRIQSVLLSATLHHEGIKDLVSLSMQDPEIVQVKTREGTAEEKILELGSSKASAFSEIPAQLSQSYIVVPCKLRMVTLFAMLKSRMRNRSKSKVVVFLSNCDTVEFHHKIFGEFWNSLEVTHNWNDKESTPSMLKMHGNMSQIERTRTLVTFTKIERGVLFATDVASRGLDFPEVSLIVQYEPPMSSEEYVHRVGRTARFGKTGEAVLFVMPSECGFIGYLHGECGLKQLSKGNTSELLNTMYGDDPKAGKDLPLDLHRGASSSSRSLISRIAEDRELKSLGESAFTSSVRSYATHSQELKPFFSVHSLHLGHYAYSFGLRDKPRSAGKHAISTKKKSMAHEMAASRHKRKRLPEIDGFNRKTAKNPGNTKNRNSQSKKKNLLNSGYVLS